MLFQRQRSGFAIDINQQGQFNATFRSMHRVTGGVY
jgi:hypothetical protein